MQDICSDSGVVGVRYCPNKYVKNSKKLAIFLIYVQPGLSANKRLVLYDGGAWPHPTLRFGLLYKTLSGWGCLKSSSESVLN